MDDPTFVANLIQETSEAHARAAEMTELANNVRLLAKALGIPEGDEDSISLAQELTDEQVAEAAGEHIQYIPGGSGTGSSRSRHSAEAEHILNEVQEVFNDQREQKVTLELEVAAMKQRKELRAKKNCTQGGKGPSPQTYCCMGS